MRPPQRPTKDNRNKSRMPQIYNWILYSILIAKKKGVTFMFQIIHANLNPLILSTSIQNKYSKRSMYHILQRRQIYFLINELINIMNISNLLWVNTTCIINVQVKTFWSSNFFYHAFYILQTKGNPNIFIKFFTGCK